jgi:hypothetical protein
MIQGDLSCEGLIRFGPLPWDTTEQLAQFPGNWLRYAPGENAIIAKSPQPALCPAFTAVACELISMMNSIPEEQRASMPGGSLYIRGNEGDVLRILVERGEVRLQWPHRNYAQPVSVTPDSVLQSLDPGKTTVRGWARFAGSCERASELEEFVNRFGGLYPEGELPSECQQNLVFVRFKDVRIGIPELLDKLRQLSETQDSLQAELDVWPTGEESARRVFRILIRDGEISTLRPSLWAGR